MDKIIVGGNVTGNVGSCEVKSNEFQKTFFTKETVAVNSCSGEIISKSDYFDGILLLIPFTVIIMVMFFYFMHEQVN